MIAIFEQALYWRSRLIRCIFGVCVCVRAHHTLAMGGPGKDLTKSQLLRSSARLLKYIHSPPHLLIISYLPSHALPSHGCPTKQLHFSLWYQHHKLILTLKSF